MLLAKIFLLLVCYIFKKINDFRRKKLNDVNSEDDDSSKGEDLEKDKI